MKRAAYLLIALLIAHAHAEVIETDVCVYGGTSAGVVAAVQAKRMGKTAVIVAPDKHLGGLSSGGLGFTDTGNKGVIGGLTREFYHRIWKHYQDPASWKWQKREEYGNKGQGTPAIDGEQRTMWIFEPHAAEKVFEEMIGEAKVRAYKSERLDLKNGVKKNGARITEIVMESGMVFRAKMFIDATYEGDLMAKVGVSYHVGREANRVYGETWNGIQVGVLHHGHWFKKPVSPFRVPGDPASGVLPRVSADPPGEKGEGDHRIQAYCFRMCLTDVPENRVPFPKPDGYDPKQYELLLRVFETGWRETFGKFDPIPNHKTDTNNHGPFSTDNIGMNYAYPDGDYATRERIIKEHETYQKGLMYFLANDSRVPEDVRSKMSQWGLPKDEFTDNGNWSHQLYIREARRMISDYVMTEQDCLLKRLPPKPVGMGSYTMDSHNVQRYITPDKTVQNEGDIGVSPSGPYQIDYNSLVPKSNQATNLFVPVCISSSHIAYGSIRMEPVFMILGQSAATAAVMAIDEKISVQDLDYSKLKARLLVDGQVLEWKTSSAVRPMGTTAPLKLEGVVVDDVHAAKTGDWKVSAARLPFIGDGYLHDDNTEKGKKTVRFTPKLQKDGRYEVRLLYTAEGNRATNVPVVVRTAKGEETLKVNQRLSPEGGGVALGVYELATDSAWVEIRTDGTDGHVIADAVQFILRP